MRIKPEFHSFPWNSGRCSKEFINFLQNPVGLDTDSQDRINKTIPVIFHPQSDGMSNSGMSPAEVQDSSGIPGGMPGGE